MHSNACKMQRTASGMSKERIERLVKIYPTGWIVFRDNGAEKKSNQKSKDHKSININSTVHIVLPYS